MKFSKSLLLKECLNHVNTDGYVDVTSLANHFGIDVIPYDFEDESYSGAISLKNDNGEIEIFVNENDPWTRQRFSIAHELAHCVLHYNQLKEQKILTRKDGLKNVMESEANYLAEQLLMPEELVLAFATSIGITTSDPLTSSTIKKFADHFVVSTMVAIIRLRNLQFNVPYIYYA
jgi:Zn-dependent peptidase ImmA (M78 family)